jgi:hypothetical protein
MKDTNTKYELTLRVEGGYPLKLFEERIKTANVLYTVPIVSFFMTGNSLEREVGEALVRNITKFSRLESLSFIFIKNSDNIPHVLNSLPIIGSTLRQLSLEISGEKEEVVPPLANFLIQARALDRLQLDLSEISPTRINLLTYALRENVSIGKLFLNFSQHHQAINTLLVETKQIPHLKYLFLRFLKVTDEEFKSVVDSLKNSSSLISFYFISKLSSKSVGTLEKFISHNKVIDFAMISGDLQQQDLDSLLKAADSNPYLRYFGVTPEYTKYTSTADSLSLRGSPAYQAFTAWQETRQLSHKFKFSTLIQAIKSGIHPANADLTLKEIEAFKDFIAAEIPTMWCDSKEELKIVQTFFNSEAPLHPNNIGVRGANLSSEDAAAAAAAASSGVLPSAEEVATQEEVGPLSVSEITGHEV